MELAPKDEILLSRRLSLWSWWKRWVGEGRCWSSDRGDVGFVRRGCILSEVGSVGLMLPVNGFSNNFGGRLGPILVSQGES
jgi:hypothetical protein